jgi:hypothetical protein
MLRYPRFEALVSGYYKHNYILQIKTGMHPVPAAGFPNPGAGGFQWSGQITLQGNAAVLAELQIGVFRLGVHRQAPGL